MFKKISLTILVLLFSVLGLIGKFQAPAQAQEPTITATVSAQATTTQLEAPAPLIFEGEVIKIIESGTQPMPMGSLTTPTEQTPLAPYQILQIKITSHPQPNQKDQLIEVKNQAAISDSNFDLQYEEYQAGNKLRIQSFPSQQNDETYYNILGQLKRPGLLALTAIFVVVVLVVGRIWGFLSLVGMGVSFLVIFQLIIPLIINGTNPILAALLGSVIIIPTTFYISHGFNLKTHVGIVSTFLALAVTGLLAIFFVQATHLTGFASEEAGFLHVERHGSIDIRGLLLAGIIIGTLGILDDVTVGQASTVEQLKKAKPNIKLWELFKQGMQVGQDHISSMVNTLVLAYSGSALPLLLLFFGNQRSLADVFESELIAEEVVRMLVGSIGLVLVAPLATFLAASWFTKYYHQK